MDSRQIPGRFRSVSAVVVAIAACACYNFSGGGGFPSEIRTVYIAPFENQTPQFDIENLLFSKMQEQLPRSLGVRPAGENVADAVIRGRIMRYDDVAQSYQPGTGSSVQVTSNQVTVTVAVEIVDVKNNVILWDSQNVSGRGEYRPDTQQDRTAWDKALDALIQQIVDGAQSQW
jgi:hypothetical protein